MPTGMGKLPQSMPIPPDPPVAAVLPFTIGAQGGFGNAYGRLRFQEGARVSEIYGLVDGVGNSPIADSNPKYLMQFGNDFTYKAFAVTVLVVAGAIVAAT